MANISSFLNKIRGAVYGKEVRGSLADGLETVNKETEKATDLSKDTEQRQTVLERKYTEQIENETDITEIKDAHVGQDGKTYQTIGKRFDSVDEQLADKASRQELESGLAPKADQAFVDAQFASIVSGAPKGTFANLQSLKDAFPDGEEGVFLVLSDGHIYYWNELKNDWLDAGLYLQQPLEDYMFEQDEGWVS